MNPYGSHGSPTESRVAVTPFLTYHSLILSGIRPGYEVLIENYLGVMGQSLWLACEGGFIWDPYGSLMRTLLMRMHRFPTITTIYVLAENGDSYDDHWPTSIDLGSYASPSQSKNIQLLLHHYQGINSESWLKSNRSDPSLDVQNALRIIRDHPLLADDIAVHGFLVHMPDLVLYPVKA